MNLHITKKIKHTRKVSKEDNYYVVIMLDENNNKQVTGWIEKEFIKEQFINVSKEYGLFNEGTKIIDLLEFGKDFNKGRLFIENYSC